MTHFYQLANLISLESWENYFEEEAKLENLYGISSIWTTIITFKSIVQGMVDDAISESTMVEQMTEVRRDAEACPSGETEGETSIVEGTKVEPADQTELAEKSVDDPVAVRTDKDHAGPSDTADQSEEQSDVELTG